jgi:hypothetical protein
MYKQRSRRVERVIVGDSNIDRYRYFVVEQSCTLDLQLGAKINPAARCVGRGNREEEREGPTAKCKDRIVSFHLLYQEMHLCGRNPRERLNHVNLVVICG